MDKYDVIIIGGGISGLATLHFLRRLKPEMKVILLEADSRLGGTIGTDKIDGYSFDRGPNGFLDRESLTLQLCKELGLDESLEKANEKVNNRFILRKSKLRAVPMSPQKFIFSDILNLSGRLRVLVEPLRPAKKDDTDESIYDFARRRIGKAAADYLVQPMVSGIYGGMADRLSLKSCFPIMREMETEYGSLFKAMIAKAKKARKAGKKAGGPAGPGGWLTSFEGGLYKIINRFSETYCDFIMTDSPVISVNKADDGFEIRTRDGRTLNGRSTVLAVPSYNAAEMTAELSPELSNAFAGIKYAPIAVVCSGYDESQVIYPVDGFGFLVPGKERRQILGSIWTSSIFKNRAPEGKVQFRTMIGGDGNHGIVGLSDNEIMSRVHDDIKDIVRVEGKPETVRVYKWDRGIPQYHIGHTERLAKIESEVSRIRGLYIAGNAYYGIGLNDCIKQAYKCVSDLS